MWVDVIEIEGPPPVVPAGFPSPAEDHYTGPVSLDRNLIRNPAATFVLRVSGFSMIDAGITDGDEILVDRSLAPADGHIVVAVVNGEFTCKVLRLRPPRLEPANKEFPVIPLPVDGEGFEVWGVVTTVIHRASIRGLGAAGAGCASAGTITSTNTASAQVTTSGSTTSTMCTSATVEPRCRPRRFMSPGREASTASARRTAPASARRVVRRHAGQSCDARQQEVVGFGHRATYDPANTDNRHPKG